MTRWALPAALLLLALSVGAEGRAEPAATRKAQARALFEQGRALMEAGRFADACPILAESDRLAPGAGTKFNLASCYERLHRLASAWSLYLEVADQMRELGQVEREALARTRGEALRPRIDRLRIVVTLPVDGLEVRRDGELVSQIQWGADVPVDPGSHRIVASAPGCRLWHGRVEASGRGEVLLVRVPRLEPEPRPAAELAAGPGLGAQRITAIVFGGLGVASLGVTVGLAVHAKNLDAQSEAFCDELTCDEEGLGLNDEAQAFAGAATVTFFAGALCAGAGLALWLAAPTEASAGSSPRATVALRASGAGLAIEW